MYKSKEIRWFSQKQNEEILDWFGEKGLLFEDSNARTDFYMPLPAKKDIGIKLREGNVEIKQRKAQPEEVSFGKTCSGFMEDYEKWSFYTSEKDPLSRAIIDQRKYNWIAVEKFRLGFNIIAENGDLKIIDLETKPTSGCQVEYTKLQILGSIFYTFGFEWFGNEFINLPEQLFLEIVGKSHLKIHDSMGYAEFLQKQQ